MRLIQKELKVKTRDNKEVYRRKLVEQAPAEQHKRFVVRDKADIKQKEDQSDGSLDRANELNRFLHRFSSETS